MDQAKKVDVTIVDETDSVRVVTSNAAAYINLSVTSANDYVTAICLSSDKARELRDVLNTLYPDDSTSEYKIEEAVGAFYIFKGKPSVEKDVIARVYTQEAAEKIVKALNEAEGL